MTALDIDDILNLLDHCLSTEFCFQDSYYRQVSGTIMGSPLSSFLAEAVIQDLEKIMVADKSDIKLWDRYVDYICSIVKTNKVSDVLHNINNATDYITFTTEEVQNNQLAFLDFLLTRTSDSSLQTQVYLKKTHMDQIVNYESNHPIQHKISCVQTLFNRIKTYCNTQQTKQDEQTYLY